MTLKEQLLTLTDGHGKSYAYAVAAARLALDAAARECEQTCLPDCGCVRDCATAIRALAAALDGGRV